MASNHPTTFVCRIQSPVPCQLGEPGIIVLAGGQGFEPQLTDSKSAVLPLDDPPAVMVVPGGFEPPANALSRHCSTAELRDGIRKFIKDPAFTFSNFKFT